MCVNQLYMLRGTRLLNPSRETKFSGANVDKKIFIFSVQLTTSRIGNLTRLIHTLAICANSVTIHTLGSSKAMVGLRSDIFFRMRYILEQLAVENILYFI